MKALSHDRKINVIDIVILAILLFCNPISWCIQCDMQYTPPDSVLYTYLAQQILNGNWTMVLFGINHIDNGVFLPPFFPFLMSLASAFVEDLYLAAPLISKLSAISVIVFSYLLMSRLSNRVVGFLVALLIGSNAQFFHAALSPLTESTFMLMLIILVALSIVLSESFYRNNKRRIFAYSFMVGFVCTLCFFTRQIGFFSYIYVSALIMFALVSSNGCQRRIKLISLLIVASTSLLIMIPYLYVTWSESGELPTKQHFRQNAYIITSQDSALYDEKRALRSRGHNGDFDRLLKNRREMRQLSPDSREMLGFIKFEKVEDVVAKNVHSTSFISSANKVFRNLKRNGLHLYRTFGEINFFLFIFSCFTPFLVRSSTIVRSVRLIIPILCLTYLLTQSYFGGLIERYVIVLFPLMIIQSASEIYVFWDRIQYSFGRYVKTILASFILVLFGTNHVYSQPVHFTQIKIEPKIIPLHRLFPEIRKNVDGDPIFATVPHFSWLAGGKHRLLPNDSLEKVKKYAEYTGVRWLLIDQRKNSAQKNLYRHIENWYQPGRIDINNKELIKYCCKATLPNGEGLFLFEFKHD